MFLAATYVFGHDLVTTSLIHSQIIVDKERDPARERCTQLRTTEMNAHRMNWEALIKGSRQWKEHMAHKSRIMYYFEGSREFWYFALEGIEGEKHRESINRQVIDSERCSQLTEGATKPSDSFSEYISILKFACPDNCALFRLDVHPIERQLPSLKSCLVSAIQISQNAWRLFQSSSGTKCAFPSMTLPADDSVSHCVVFGVCRAIWERIP
jgi:hypothetical protein